MESRRDSLVFIVPGSAAATDVYIQGTHPWFTVAFAISALRATIGGGSGQM
jgi:hypothetical protein